MKKQTTTRLKLQEYSAVFQEERNGGYSVWVPDLPGCASQGETIEEAMANIKEAMELYLEDDDMIAWVDDLDYAKQFVVPIKINA